MISKYDLYTYDGKTQELTAWAEDTGITASGLACRLRKGWSLEATFTTPRWGRSNPGLICLRDAAKFLGISYSHMIVMTRRGRLPQGDVIRGKSRFYTTGHLESILQDYPSLNALPPTLTDIHTLAAHLGVPSSTFHKWRSRGWIPSGKKMRGNRIIYTVDQARAIETWMDARPRSQSRRKVKRSICLSLPLDLYRRFQAMSQKADKGYSEVIEDLIRQHLCQPSAASAATILQDDKLPSHLP